MADDGWLRGRGPRQSVFNRVHCLADVAASGPGVRRSRTFPMNRPCRGCGRNLSRYNPGEECSGCANPPNLESGLLTAMALFSGRQGGAQS